MISNKDQTTTDFLLRQTRTRAREDLKFLRWALNEVEGALDEDRPLPNPDEVASTAAKLQRTLLEAAVLRYHKARDLYISKEAIASIHGEREES